MKRSTFLKTLVAAPAAIAAVSQAEPTPALSDADWVQKMKLSPKQIKEMVDKWYNPQFGGPSIERYDPEDNHLINRPEGGKFLQLN